MIATTEKVTFNADGSTTVAILGPQGQATVPGAGLIATDVDRLVLRFPAGGEPEVLFEAGRQFVGPFPALCPYLT